MKTKVLIVDDSLTMRALFTSALESSDELVVVGAADGADEARQLIAQWNPHVITLDVEMPGKNGLEFLEELMETRPIPVVMLSTLTQKGADVSLKAIELGAVDCFPKPQKATPDEFKKITGKLCKTVLTASKSNLTARSASAPAAGSAPRPTKYVYDGELLTISGGMGGMEAASDMLASFPADCPPTILLLEIEEGLAVPFASRLNRAIAPEVRLAADGAPLRPGTIYLAADPEKHVVVDRWPGGVLRLVDRPPVNGNRPSADLLLTAVAKTAKAKARSVMLSGGGEDGVAGMAAVLASGGCAMAQAPETALINEAILAARGRGVTRLAPPQALGLDILLPDIANAA